MFLLPKSYQFLSSQILQVFEGLLSFIVFFIKLKYLFKGFFSLVVLRELHIDFTKAQIGGLILLFVLYGLLVMILSFSEHFLGAECRADIEMNLTICVI